MNLLIESESTLAVKCVNNRGICPLKLLNVFNLIDYYKVETNGLSFLHIYRASNSFAHSLAKQGALGIITSRC